MADPTLDERAALSSEGTEEEEFFYLLNEASDRLGAGRVEDARAHLEKALELRPGHEQARNLLGLCLFRLGRLEEAEALFVALVDDNPVEPSLRLNLAMVQLKAGKPQEARAELERVLDLNPSHARAVSYMGVVLERLERFEEAAEWYARAGQDARAAEMRARASAPPKPPSAEERAPPALEATSPGRPAPSWAAPPPDPGDKPSNDGVSPLPPMIDDELASGEVQAAALSAMRAEAMSRPARPPEPQQIDAAEKARLGFTLDDVPQASDEAPPAPSNAREEGDPPPPPPPEPTPEPPASAAGILTTLAELAADDAAHKEGTPRLLGSGLLAFPAADVVYLRADRLVGLAGAFKVEPLNRRYRGRRTDSLFGGNQTPMMAAIGSGVAWLDPGDAELLLVSLDGEELYLVEPAVYAFSSGLVWENGRLPDEDGPDLDIVHLRGTGTLALGTSRPIFSLQVRPERPVTVHAERLIGWSGSVIPSRGPLPGLPESARRPAIVRFEGTGRVLAL